MDVVESMALHCVCIIGVGDWDGVQMAERKMCILAAPGVRKIHMDGVFFAHKAEVLLPEPTR